jgi:hypothetical protein
MFVGRGPAASVGRSVWFFLARAPFAAKAPANEGWIYFDFLGFSRPNRAFSMSYTGKSTKTFFRVAFLRSVGDAGRSQRSVAAGTQNFHDESLAYFLIICNP